MQLTPLGARVVLTPHEAEQVTVSGIIIPDTAGKERPVRGTVVQVGPGKMQKDGSVRPVAVKAGDQVLFKKYGPDEVELDGTKYLIADEDDILAVIK